MYRLRQRLGLNAARVASVSALVVAAILFFIVLGTSGSSYELKAAFDDVRGLIPGSPVRAGAVQVGTIEKVELVGDKPVVTMKVQDIIELHQGATANIELFSNAGAVNRTIELTQGDPSKPEIDHDVTLRGPQTDQPVNFDDASEILDGPTRDNLRQLLKGLDASLKGRGQDFDAALQNSSAALNETANLLAQVNSDGESLRTVIDKGSQVTSALASSPGDLAGAADSTARLLSVTARRQAELSRSVELLGPSLSRGGDALDALAVATPRLRTLVRDLAPVADQLGPFARALPPALDSAGPFLSQTRRLVDEAPGYLADFGPIIASARAVAPQLGDLITKALPLAQSLRAYIPDTVGFFQNLGSSLGTYDANGHVVSLTGSFAQSPPSSSTTEIGPEACGAGAVVKPYIRFPGALECEPWTDYDKTASSSDRRGK